MKMPARGKAALALRYDLPLLLLSAVAQPLAALPPYGCGTPLAGAALPVSWQCSLISVYRGTHQCGECNNAAFGTQSAAVLSSHAPHDNKARLISVTIRRRFMAKPCTPHPIAQRVQFFKPKSGNVGGRGVIPSRSLGGPRGDILSRERISPFPRAAPSALLPCGTSAAKRFAPVRKSKFF